MLCIYGKNHENFMQITKFSQKNHENEMQMTKVIWANVLLNLIFSLLKSMLSFSVYIFTGMEDLGKRILC